MLSYQAETRECLCGDNEGRSGCTAAPIAVESTFAYGTAGD